MQVKNSMQRQPSRNNKKKTKKTKTWPWEKKGLTYNCDSMCLNFYFLSTMGHITLSRTFLEHIVESCMKKKSFKVLRLFKDIINWFLLEVKTTQT